MLRIRKSAIQFAGRKHPVEGIISTIIAIITFSICIVLFYLSTKEHGASGIYLGLFGVLLLFFALAGIIVGVKGIRKEDIYFTYPVIGLVGNGCLFVGLLVLYLMGLGM